MIIVLSSACSGDYPIETMRYRYKCCNSVAFDGRVVWYINTMFLANSFTRYGLMMPHWDMYIWFNIGEYIFGSNILLSNSTKPLPRPIWNYHHHRGLQLLSFNFYIYFFTLFNYYHTSQAPKNCRNPHGLQGRHVLIKNMGDNAWQRPLFTH